MDRFPEAPEAPEPPEPEPPEDDAGTVCVAWLFEGFAVIDDEPTPPERLWVVD